MPNDTQQAARQPTFPTEEMEGIAQSRAHPGYSSDDGANRLHAAESAAATEIETDPGKVRVWDGNARYYPQLNEKNCRDLIDSIIATDGQKVPVVLRRLQNDPNHDFEVIAGARRHWAISWLQANGHPNIQLIGIVKALNEEEAFILADAENRARKDVSDFERARNYAAALNSVFNGHQTLMAKKLGISKGWLSKMLKVADLPAEVLEAFEDTKQVTVAALYPVAKMMKDIELANAVTVEAAKIANEQGNRFWVAEPPLSPAEVIRRLKSVGQPQPKPRQPNRFEAHDREGRVVLTAEAVDKHGITLRLHGNAAGRRAEVMEAVAQALDWVMAQ